MGVKSRGNYGTGGYCAKFDCANRDKKCKGCLRLSEYVKEKKG
jgi:hypothetical protein